MSSRVLLLKKLTMFFNTKKDKEFKNIIDEEAFDLFTKLLNKFTESNIKKYNTKDKALDEFSAKEFLNYMDRLVNQSLEILIIRDDIKTFKRYLNSYINLSWKIIQMKDEYF